MFTQTFKLPVLDTCYHGCRILPYVAVKVVFMVVGVVRVVEVVRVVGVVEVVGVVGVERVVGIMEIGLCTGYLRDAASFSLSLVKMYRFLCAGKSDATALYLPSKRQKSTLSEVLQP